GGVVVGAGGDRVPKGGQLGAHELLQRPPVVGEQDSQCLMRRRTQAIPPLNPAAVRPLCASVGRTLLSGSHRPDKSVRPTEAFNRHVMPPYAAPSSRPSSRPSPRAPRPPTAARCSRTAGPPQPATAGGP